MARRRLQAQLDASAGASVTMLVAPAGSGKTVGVGGWANAAAQAGEGGPVWVQADATWDADRLESQLVLAEDPAEERPRLVIVDDAHQLPAESIGLIDERLTGAPTSIRLLLLSRWDLPLAKTVPELLGHLTVLRGDVLRLDDDEVAALVAVHARTTAPEVVDAIAERAHGWCAAVVLTARAVGAAADPLAAARHYARDPGGVAGQVASEVFASLQPRERHLLLCVAAEETVTAATATALTHDTGAGETLSQLAVTGLLVTRLDGASVEGPLADEPEARFRVHPLLLEVVRRRLARGGVDVERARSTVRRAVMLDLTRGEVGDGFRRLVTAGELEAAAELLGANGIAMINRGEVAPIAGFVRDHLDVVEAHPETWAVVLTERWVAGDTDTARHWSDRIHASGTVAVARAADEPLMTALAVLTRARLGLADLTDAVAAAQSLADAEQHAATHATDRAMLPQLLTELGIVQTWVGDLAAGERNLSAALELTRTRNLPALAIAATSHLALTEFLLGREHTCVEVATEALRLVDESSSWRPTFAAARAKLALTLGSMTDPPWTGVPAHRPSRPTPAHPADLLTRFLSKICDARVTAAAGSVTDAQTILEAPLDFPLAQPLPAHLALTLELERGFLAFLAGDAAGVRTVEQRLVGLGLTAEGALLAALRADLHGDARAAADLFVLAADRTTCRQPPVRSLALASYAQLLAAEGHHSAALRHLHEAVVATSVRRNATPFLGWVRHGARSGALMTALAEQMHAPAGTWLARLGETFRDRPDVAASYAHTVSTKAELESGGVSMPAVGVTLSGRERDVLLHLARGATYADIAANLVVSENTVKSHVSSLYAKLGVSRRREALLLARELHLI
ncbi:LuxR C-terminal-related transcriptional regulator [Nocardioides sp. CER19]|uniref:helix-turn-helix transcriptional regulator n=1 Tax=Nocardioides sp. CER19 TaxID=3038538 RepID=UPI00244B9071|nr:LuxR C-terminal-related transcriptional regulator [Nocardioides sp. CER19]MDH2416280.1 LuxR C-terminal-related transcriptional regulator [Nocardioides sp. CER19]